MLQFFIFSTTLSFVLMFITWAVSYRINNYSLVDATWALGFTPLALLIAFLQPHLLLKQYILVTFYCFWSFRLGVYLLKRISSHITVEEVRYQHLRKSFEPYVASKFLIFFLFQSFIQVGLTLPLFLYAQPTQDSAPRVTEVLGFILFPLALSLESLADHQLSAFRADPKNKGKVCEVGLWNYSRHPNYFFEFLIWCSFACVALTSPQGYLALSAPLLMIIFLIKVTGIPLTEELSLKSRGEAYRRYQQTTSAFIPWFKKK